MGLSIVDWFRKLPVKHRQSLLTVLIFVVLTATLVGLIVGEFSWSTSTEGRRIAVAYPKFASKLGDLITALCVEAQAAVSFINDPTNQDLYTAYTATQRKSDAAYNASYEFIRDETAMHVWDSDFTIDDGANLMTAQGVGVVTRVRTQLMFNEVVFSAQTAREKYMNAIKRVISIVQTISQIYHEQDNFMGFSRASALSSSAYAVLQLQKHTVDLNNYIATGADASLLADSEREIIRYLFVYETMINLFVMPTLDNAKKYSYLIQSSTTYADDYVIQMYNEVTARKDLPASVTSIAISDSLEEVLKVMKNYQDALPNEKRAKSTLQTHQILIIILLVLSVVCLIFALLDFLFLRFYNSKSSREALHNSRVMHDLLIRVAEYAKEIGTFSLSPPPPPQCVVEERRVGIVEQQLQFLVGSLKAAAPFLPPLLFPYDFKIKADEFSEVKDPGTMVLTEAPRESLESMKLSLEDPHSFTPYFVPMAQKTDIQEQVCDVALLYVSLSVFHELDTTEKRNLSAEYYQEVVSIIEECVYLYNGVLTTVAFERAVAVWNIAHKAPDFCEQAAACALMLSDRLTKLRSQKRIVRENFLVHLGVVGGTVNVGVFGNEDRKVLTFFGPPVLRGMFVAQTNGYHMTTVACDDYIRSAIQKMYYCKPIELIPEGGCVHQILHEVSRDDSELELQLATYCKAFEFFERQYHKSALKAFRAYTKQYGYDSSVERIQALIAGS